MPKRGTITDMQIKELERLKNEEPKSFQEVIKSHNLHRTPIEQWTKRAARLVLEEFGPKHLSLF